MNTEKMEMKEREISLIDILVEILLHWRKILLFMIIGGILLGGFSYLRLSKAVKSQPQMDDELITQKEMAPEEILRKWEQQKIELEERLGKEQVNNVNMALAYQQLYEKKMAYCQNSSFMQIDPIQLYQTELVFLFQAENMEKINNIKIVNENLLSSAAFYTYIQEQCELKSDVSELITIYQPETRKNTNTNVIEQSSKVLLEQSTGIISIRILYNDIETCQIMSDAVISYVWEKQMELRDIFGDYDVELVEKGQGKIIDKSLLEAQRIFIEDMTTLHDCYNNLKKEFSDNELQYYNFMIVGKPVDNKEKDINEKLQADGYRQLEETTTMIDRPGINKRYVILGMVLFAFIYVFIIFIVYVMNDKLLKIDNFQKICGVSHLGTIPRLPSKRFLGEIDRWILKISYRGCRQFTPEESIALVAVAVKMAVKNQNLKQVYLIGCNIRKTTEEVCEKIKNFLEEEQIETIVLNNVLYHAEAMEQLGNAEGVVLIETVGSTLYGEIESEIQLLNRQKIAVLGGVIVE